MGIIGKIFGKKKEEIAKPDLALGQERDLGLGTDEESYEPGPAPKAQPFPAEPEPFSPKPQGMHYPQQPVMSTNKDLEIISAKLDSIKSALDNLNYRLQNIEKIAREGQ